MGAPRITDNVALIAHGEMAGNTGDTACTSVKGAKWVKFKAAIDNAGNVFIGKTGVTKMAGTTTATAGFPLDAGQETDWLPVPGNDLANYHYICDNAGDDFAYQVLG